MRLTDDIYASTIRHYKQYMTPPEGQGASESETTLSEEPAVLLDLSFGMPKKDEKTNYLNSIRANKNNDVKNGDLQDHSSRLTRRLVAAKSREEVHSILSEAYKNLGEALRAAAGGDEKAQEIIKRINKLIRRANRKVRDLTKEDELRRKESKAKKDELEQLAKQLELELKQKIAERKKRERKYLKDANPQNDKTKHQRGIHPNATLSIKIQALLHQMAYSKTISAQADTSAGAPAEAGETQAASDSSA